MAATLSPVIATTLFDQMLDLSWDEFDSKAFSPGSQDSPAHHWTPSTLPCPRSCPLAGWSAKSEKLELEHVGMGIMLWRKSLNTRSCDCHASCYQRHYFYNKCFNSQNTHLVETKELDTAPGCLKVKDIKTGVRVFGYSLTCTMPGHILDSLVPVGRETQCCRKVFRQCKSCGILDLPSIWWKEGLVKLKL